MSTVTPNEFLGEFETYLRPRAEASCKHFWKSNLQHSPQDEEARAAIDKEMRLFMARRDRFATAKDLRESSSSADEITRRQLELTYLGHLGSQGNEDDIKRMVDLEIGLESVTNSFRATLDGKQVTNNDIKDILSDSTDLPLRKRAWEASKQLGEKLNDNLLEVIGLRNKQARDLGFENYHTMGMTLSELVPGDVKRIFDDLKTQSDGIYREVKGRLDGDLAARYGLAIADLRPWHYADPFFQEAPAVGSVALDPYYKGKDLIALTTEFYDSLGLEIRDLIGVSDLFERDGKCQHAFCIDMNRKGDVRVLCNVRPTESWMGTMLHEYGHAVYDKYIDQTLPWTLHEPAHIFATEAIAMLMGRLSKDAAYLKSVVGVPADEAERLGHEIARIQQLEMLISARWIMTFVAFERELYADPKQNLNDLWWDLVEEIQLVHRPEGRHTPDWAAKTHFATAPVYYHNYLLGELTASQLYASLAKLTNGHPIVGNRSAGDWLVKNVFMPGNRYHWQEMLTRATGEPLNPRYFVEQFMR